jgi:large subunit ribosomal protein L5
MAPRIKEQYANEIVPALMREFALPNPMQTPRLLKIVINLGFAAGTDKDVARALVEDLGRICGQRPVMTRARKSISNFKLREGMEIGAKVTLRGDRMYEFLDRLINAALPRTRDFRGISPKSFDGRGNYTFGITDHTIFPEIDPDQVKQVHGMDITMVTSSGSDEQALKLLRAMGMPFMEG